MNETPYQPVYELTRGDIVESIHFGAIAIVDVYGNLLAWHGDPGKVSFLRSTAKPFQALPFLTEGGQSFFQITPREIAVMVSSHSGTDEHVSVVQSLQVKTGVDEADLLCGVHYPYHEPTLEAMRERQEQPTPNRHNCSGKHTGMLSYIGMKEGIWGDEAESLPYIDVRHPVQLEILRAVSEMCDVAVEDIEIGIDGCSVPNFAIPLRNAALGFARLCDPETGGVQPPSRAYACRAITSAMIFNPDMVGGPGRFDTRLMEVAQGKVISKGGAEGYQGIGVMPGVVTPDSPAFGIAMKISDGDPKGRARSAVALEVLRSMGVLPDEDLDLLEEFGPTKEVTNWRKLVVGQARPSFDLKRPS